MSDRNRVSMWSTATATGLMLIGTASLGVELTDLKGWDVLFGRYAPGGDCSRQPRIVVDVSGFTFDVDGKTQKVTNPEHVLEYQGPDYKGIAQWFFPYHSNDVHPILMTFNAGETRGRLAVEAYDEGYQGGPPLTAWNKALVGGSPYAKCK